MMKKKICSLCLTVSLLAGTFATSVLSADLGTEKLYSKSNPAVFNGTTAITVPVGEKVDLTETEYRIFANDFEDGDCTANIQITGNNYKDEAGKYQIKYKVTDAHGNEAVETVEVNVEERKNKLIERTLYTLPDISNMDMVGTHRGNNHDRQNIGLYLKAGDKIRIRQKNTAFMKDLKLSLDTDDSQTGKSYNIPKDGSWLTVEADYDCVPDIFTPKNVSSNPVVEIEYDKNVESLVYYRYQDEQEQFFEAWDESDASYAMLETNRAAFLVPKKDKNHILAAKEVSDACILEFDVYQNIYGQIDNDTKNVKHIAFLKSDEVESAAVPATHHQEKALPSEFLDTDVLMKLRWDADLQQLTYEMYPAADEKNVIKDTFAFKVKEELKTDEVYLLVSAASGQAGEFAFELISFENGATKINKFNDLFAKPLGNGVNVIEGNKIVFTEAARQMGAVNTKDKINLAEDFVLTGIVNIANDSDGMAFALHNDARGTRAAGSNNGALGVFKTDNQIDYSGFDSIDELLEFYDMFTEEFDEYIGLSYDTEELIHQNIRTKFFVKADAHGIGAAYYGGEHTAQNGDTIDAYLSRNWLPIHEFGHGYEGSLARQELALVDVLNNVLSHYMEQTFKDPESGGWLGKKQEIEQSIANNRDVLKDYHDYNQLDYRDRLYSLVNLLDKIGAKGAMGALHTFNREAAKEDVYYNTTDMMTKIFSEYSGKNVIPYLQSWKLEPGNAEKANVYEKDFPILYYLRDCVDSDKKAVEIMKDLKCDGIYSLVTVDELKKYNLSGNLELTLSIDDLNQLKGKKVVIKNGKEVVKECVISENKLTVKNLPVGAYEIEIPNTKNVPYLYDYQYAVISDGQTTKKEINYQKDYNTIDSDICVNMLGLGDWQFSTVAYDKTEGNLKVVTNSGQPHSYYKNKPYAEITVSDGNDTLYNRTYIGDEENKNTTEEIKVSVGNRVTIWHAEASTRFKAFGNLTNQEETDYQANDKTANYIVTKYGLMPADFTEENIYQMYYNRVKQYAESVDERLTKDQKSNKNVYPTDKNILRRSLVLLNEKDREALENKYAELFNGSKPIITVKQTKFKVGDGLDISSVLKAEDKEDGVILLTQECLKLENVPMKDGKFAKAGNYTVSYEITDTDENLVNGNVEFIIQANEEIVSANKQKLQKLTNSAKKYEDKIVQYTSKTAENFKEALKNARNVLEKEDASQSEVEEAYKNLQHAVFGLRQIPNKEKLEELGKR